MYIAINNIRKKTAYEKDYHIYNNAINYYIMQP